ncbi:YgfZ/GcvT domain-containing protein [Solimicrobium silvestre]|uniref:Folate-binding protein YgfZ n=1 Tax=Solimicrobium silvestre TaxID=2099400 RepID=A0A2S9GVF8_9BURK|nr:folate-binding protein YgfZ [Solimicrobium silvestre]PRC91646.1 Folate-binding protein YgfZ [Solimicrobium silvestre]
MHALTLPKPLNNSLSGFCKLSQFALITASGVDAANFLQSQLTNDIKSLAANRACLAGYCTPKGRLLASMLIWKTTESATDTITIEVPAELQEALQKRLQMFVMRAQVKLHHSSPTSAILGILGADAAAQLAEWFPTLPVAPYELVNNESGTLLRLADAQGIARYQWITTKEFAEQAWPALLAISPSLPEHVWGWSEIHAGIPHISLATQEKFVPQMINYELIGGVNFKKGCYPGQEIVARSQYLGKQKRRMVLAQINSATVHSGMEVFASDDLSQPCGMVVNAQPNGADGSDCLIEIKTAYLKDATVQLSSGEVCNWLPMPYPLPDDTLASTDQPTS